MGRIPLLFTSFHYLLVNRREQVAIKALPEDPDVSSWLPAKVMTFDEEHGELSKASWTRIKLSNEKWAKMVV